MKIVIATNNYTPYSGGVVSSIKSFTKELQAQGHEVFIVTLDFLGTHEDDPEYVIRIPSVARFMYKKNHMAIPMQPTKKVFDIIKKIQPDIIHTQHPFLIGVSALKAAKKLQIPIVFTYHSLYEMYAHYVPLPQFLSKPIIKKLVLSFCKQVDGIIVPGSHIKNYLLKEGIKTPISTIPSGINPIFFKPLQKNNENKKEFNLLTVSRFAKEKNIPFLLRVFANLHKHNPNFTFTLAGYGAEYKQLQNYAYKTLQLPAKSIAFIHKPEKARLVTLYQHSDLFVFSSKSETQGIVMAEAMSGSCPVVAVNGPGQEDIVKNDENGFLVDSEKQMAEKIIHIAQKKEVHEKLSHSALKTAQNYHPKAATKKLINFYKKTTL